MGVDTIIYMLTWALGVLVIIWHQQRCLNKCRDAITSAINGFSEALKLGPANDDATEPSVR